MPATLRAPSTTPGCPVTIASTTITFAPWDLDWELYGEILTDGSHYIYNFTRAAAKAITGKSGTEGAGYSVTVAAIGAWASGDLCLILPKAYATLTTAATPAAVVAAGAAYDDVVTGYAAAGGNTRHAVFAQGVKPMYVWGHLSRQRCYFAAGVTASGDQSGNTTQVTWRNLSGFNNNSYAFHYNDSGAGKTGGGVYLRRFCTYGNTGFYNQSSGANVCRVELGTIHGGNNGLWSQVPILVYHITAIGCGNVAFNNNNQTGTWTNCVALDCTTGFGTKTNGTYTDCFTDDGTGTDATTVDAADFWRNNDNGYSSWAGRILTTSSLYNAGTAVGGLTTDIDGTAIGAGTCPVGCHSGTTTPYGITHPTASNVLTGSGTYVAWDGTKTPSAAGEAHTANQVLKSAGGNYNDDNLSDGNVRPVAYGLAATGDLSNLVATDAAYGALEATRNTDPGVGFVQREADGGPASYLIQGATKTPALNTAAIYALGYAAAEALYATWEAARNTLINAAKVLLAWPIRQFGTDRVGEMSAGTPPPDACGLTVTISGTTASFLLDDVDPDTTTVEVNYRLAGQRDWILGATITLPTLTGSLAGLTKSKLYEFQAEPFTNVTPGEGSNLERKWVADTSKFKAILDRVEAEIEALVWSGWTSGQVTVAWAPALVKDKQLPRVAIAPGNAPDSIVAQTNTSYSVAFPVRLYLMDRVSSRDAQIEDLLAKREALRQLFMQRNVLSEVDGVFNVRVEPMPVVNDPDIDERMLITGVELAVEVEETR